MQGYSRQETPSLDFFYALKAVREELEKRKLFEQLGLDCQDKLKMEARLEKQKHLKSFIINEPAWSERSEI